MLLSGTHKRVAGLFAYADVNECEENNGGCDEKRECINTEGDMECGDCSTGWRNNGDKDCDGERPHGELGMRS